jgi:hypothetical protein
LRCIFLAEAVTEGGLPELGHCGDYSTTVINHNHLSSIGLKMKWIDDPEIVAKYLI